MDTLLNTVAILCASLVVLCAWKVVNVVWVRPKKLEKFLREQGFNGNKYKLLFGDMKEMAMMHSVANSKPLQLSSSGDEVLRRVLPLHHHLHKRYGKNYMIWFGWTPTVQIMEPEVVKAVLMNSNEFLKKKLNPLAYFLATGVANYDGDKWFRHRRILNPGFHVEKIKNLLPVFKISCGTMIKKWETSVMTKGSVELDVWNDVRALTCDVIARTSFGSSYEEGIRIFELLREQQEHVSLLLQSIYIPGQRFLPTKQNKRITAIRDEVTRLLKGIIDARMKEINAGEGKNDDLLGLMIESNMKNIDGSNEIQGMTIEDIIEECKLFYFAGQETTSSLLLWTLILLSKHQDWQARAREEVLNAFGDKSVDADGLSHLKVVTMIIYEVLRLFPPAVFVERRMTKETKVGGYTLPMGTEVGIPIMQIHYDTDVYGDDAKEFNPERFAEGISKASKNNTGAFYPFGGGPRICIGQNFAILEARLALTMILKNFSFDVSPSYVHAPRIVLTLQPQYGAPLILRKL